MLGVMTTPSANMGLVRITDWLWCLRTPLVQAYAIRHRDGFNLIDTGIADGEEAILRSLASIEQSALEDVRVYEILLTHGHDDHTGAAAALAKRTGARVLSSAVDAPVIEGEQPAAAPQLADWEMQLYEQIHPHVPPAAPVPVDDRLADGAALDWIEPARVIAAPGHTPGSVAVLFARAKVVIAGDAIATREGEPMLGVFNSDPGQAVESFRNLAELDVDVVCVGHGDPILTSGHDRLARAVASRRS